jgi:hypothetical protein
VASASILTGKTKTALLLELERGIGSTEEIWLAIHNANTVCLFEYGNIDREYFREARKADTENDERRCEAEADGDILCE